MSMNTSLQSNRSTMHWVGINFDFSIALAKARVAYKQAIAVREARREEADYYKMLNSLYSDEAYNIEMKCLAEENMLSSLEADYIFQDELELNTECKDAE